MNQPELVRTEVFHQIDDKDFQDWLHGVGLMTRRKVKEEDLMLKKPPKIAWRTANQAISLLLRNEGYIISVAKAAEQLYGGYIPDADMNNTRNIYEKLRAKLVNRDMIFNARGLGWGVGIEEFRLFPADIAILYPLWQRLGERVEKAEIAAAVSGQPDNNEAVERSMRSLKSRVSTLKSATLIGSSVAMETSPGGYKHEPWLRLFEIKRV